MEFLNEINRWSRMAHEIIPFEGKWRQGQRIMEPLQQSNPYSKYLSEWWRHKWWISPKSSRILLPIAWIISGLLGVIIEFARILGRLDAWISLIVFAISMSFSGKFFARSFRFAGGLVVYSFLFELSKVHIWPTHTGQRWQMRWKRNPRCIGNVWSHTGPR